jgi:SAM-dependent methyltransferase
MNTKAIFFLPRGKKKIILKIQDELSELNGRVKMKARYYKIAKMDIPTADMYDISNNDKVLAVGTASKLDWAITIDIDPQSPADIIADGLNLPFANNSFDVVVLDFVTNFLKPKDVNRLISEARRVGKTVKGRCHVGTGAIKGPKQRFCHEIAPQGVEWIETRKEIMMLKFHLPKENSSDFCEKLKEWKNVEVVNYDHTTETLETSASGNVVRRLYGQLYKQKIVKIN